MYQGTVTPSAKKYASLVERAIGFFRRPVPVQARASRGAALGVCSAILALVLCGVANASYGLYVGKNLTADGSVFLGGTGEEVSSHWLRIEPNKKHEPGEKISVGVTKDAFMPGELMEIPQVEETAAFISMDYSDFEDFRLH
jgi:hypothetical protein